MAVHPPSHRQGRPGSAPTLRVMLLVALIVVPPAIAAYYGLVFRPARQQRALDNFLALDAAHDCCYEEGGDGSPLCASSLRELVRITRAGEASRTLPDWMPGAARDAIQALRLDDVVSRAEGIYQRCPAAHELVEPGVTAGARLCGMVASTPEREDLARDAAQRGTLQASLLAGPCSEGGFDAGLARLQIDFQSQCASDACLPVLLAAPTSSRARVQEIVDAHADAVLAGLAPRLAARDPRAARLLEALLGPDSAGIIALGRGDVSEPSLTAALNLLTRPIGHRTALALIVIRDRADGPASAVAALLLDLAEVEKANEAQLGQALSNLQHKNCALLERVAPLIDLGFTERAEAALPALLGCPKAAQALLVERNRLALSRPVLEAALKGRFGPVEDMLIDRLDDGSDLHLQMLVSLASQRDTGPAAIRLLKSLGKVMGARQKAIDAALLEVTDSH